ncbi:MAG: hypothetical protein IKQ20_03275 [Bacteroidales bacterium]|nr:hypothetical protein [Bacteroidales bacterium]
MWSLHQLYAKDFSAFKQLDYAVQQGHATLIFGNNMDNDSQLSNGSGKSALIEAIAVGLTGATLRNIKIDEIINDNADEATVSLLLSNDFTGEHLSITRTLSRKNPQVIEVSLSDEVGRDGEFKWSPVSQPSVNDYNKYILDTIGITKDDIYANYILCKHKYTSFLSSSDKEKKEIINRFSNGILVDESIAALQADMEPIQQSLYEAEKAVSTCVGRVEAIDDQIAQAKDSAEERVRSREERIKGLNESIAEKRELIRSKRDIIAKRQARLTELDEAYKKLCEIEESDAGVEDANEKAKKLFASYDLPCPEYTKRTANLKSELKDLQIRLDKKNVEVEACEAEVAAINREHKKLVKEYDEFKATLDTKMPEVNTRIQDLLKKARELEDTIARNKRESSSLERQIAELEKRLAGVITCPKCGHEFTIADDLDIKQTRDDLANLQDSLEENDKLIETNQKSLDGTIEDGKKARKEQEDLNTQRSDWSGKISDSNVKVNNATGKQLTLANELRSIQGQIADVEKSISEVRQDMFDDAFAVIDAETETCENVIKDSNRAIQIAEGSIKSFEESIEDIKGSMDNDMVKTLEENKKRYQEELDEATKSKNDIEAKLAEFRSQEATFVEFKTHLANSKIEALANITNGFLEAIGSDIRIAFSGFTVLKSGKVRDKISISLLRDGINCGSFDKFSEGEKARVNLANILAMHKLTNVSCEEGKGLDLLILDEILDATDETGLANIFESLNSLQITSLVVSHGNIAENYPYKLIVNKKNGVSFI